MTLSLVAVATVDENGAYQPADAGPTPLPFELAQQADGEWRITQVRDGIVLDREVFPSVFHDYSRDVLRSDLAVPRARRALVPDRQRGDAGRRALVNKPPSDWLADSVTTAFPESVSLVPSVPVDVGRRRGRAQRVGPRRPARHHGPDADPARGEPRDGGCHRRRSCRSGTTPIAPSPCRCARRA